MKKQEYPIIISPKTCSCGGEMRIERVVIEDKRFLLIQNYCPKCGELEPTHYKIASSPSLLSCLVTLGLA